MKEKLALDETEERAVEIFKKYSQDSLESTKTTVNNWIHNLVVS